MEITTEDRFLPLGSALDLARAPVPEGEEPAGPLVASGARPVWLHLAYSRWLRSVAPAAGDAISARPIGHWDAATGRAVFIHGAGAPRAELWRVEGGMGPARDESG